jgi:hypothetical protein
VYNNNSRTIERDLIQRRGEVAQAMRVQHVANTCDSKKKEKRKRAHFYTVSPSHFPLGNTCGRAKKKKFDKIEFDTNYVSAPVTPGGLLLE